MPDPVTPPPDAGAGDAGGAAAGGAASGGPAEKSFTQADVDKIIAERLRRAVPADYEDLKTKAGRLDELEAGQKSELEKEKAARTKAEDTAKTALAIANGRLIRAEILMQATVAGAVDADTVAALLAGNSSVTVDDDGTVQGAKKAVADLLKEKPFLVKGAGGSSSSGNEFGGSDPKDAKGKLEALRNEVARMVPGKERQAKQAELRSLEMQRVTSAGPPPVTR